MSRHTWEGAELAFYIDGESYSFTLSDKQFECVARILGFQMNLDNGEITTCSSGSPTTTSGLRRPTRRGFSKAARATS